MVMDPNDRRILSLLQEDGSLSVQDIARRLDLAPTSCWRRVKALEDSGVLRKRVALVDAEAVGLGLVAYVFVRTNQHEPSWLKRFAEAVSTMPEILETHRLSGETDYLIKAVVADMKGYDTFYKRLISAVPLYDVSTSFSMECIKETTALPLTMGTR
jgi:Lrp/AsnC family transcriptional regulator